MTDKYCRLARLIISNRYMKAKQPSKSPQHQNEEENQSSTIDPSAQLERIRKTIRGKCRVFANYDLRKSLPQSPRKTSTSPFSTLQGTSNTNFKVIMKEKQVTSRPHVSQPSKSQGSEPSRCRKISLRPLPQRRQQNIKKLNYETSGLKSDRRQRFMKSGNPELFIRHYIERQHYQPTEQQMELIDQMLALKKLVDQDPMPLEAVLQRIYGIMNLTVDYNEMMFLCRLILLAADICFFSKEFPRAFYFYNQARIAGSYAHRDRLKLSALIGLGKLIFQTQDYPTSARLFKKGLQYAWRAADKDRELEIYDWLGQTLQAEGTNQELSLYYHTRFAQSQTESADSTFKKISNRMLKDYDEYISSLEDANLDSLFIEYLNLPLGQQYDTKKKSPRQFINYSNGSSPRMNKKLQHSFDKADFPDLKAQIDFLLGRDEEFKQEIPDPDHHVNFHSSRKFGRQKKELDFQHSLVFNEIVGFKQQKADIEKMLKLPLDAQVQKKLEDRLDPLWYEKMVHEINKRRSEKVGTLKERVRNSHLSYHKYPMERKRNNAWCHEKIVESFNRTLLDWIDPQAV